MNQSCSKSKWIVYTLFVVLLPIFLIAAIINFAPAQVARLFVNPDKIRSVFEYQQKQDQKSLEKKAKDLIKKDIANEKGNLVANAMDPVIGTKDAKVTVVEYIDYKCVYCKKAHEEIVKVLSDAKYRDSVRLIIKHYPVVGGEVSLYASEVAVAFYLRHSAEFPALHSKLFASPLNTKAEVDEILKSFGTTYAKIKNDKVRDSIIANFNFARTISISGTPAFVIGDEFVGGYISAEEFTALIDKKL